MIKSKTTDKYTEEADILMDEKFRFTDFESFKKDLYEKIEIGLKQVDEGKTRPIEELFNEMETGFGLNE